MLADLTLPLGQRALTVKVNLIIRLATGLLFGAAFAWLVRRTRHPAEPPAQSLVLLVLALYLVAAWFWPWYVLWVLPLAALAPAGLARTIALLLSAAALLLYALSESAWTYSWRAAFVFGLPLVGAALLKRAANHSHVTQPAHLDPPPR